MATTTHPRNDRKNGNVKGFGALVIASTLMPFIPGADIGTAVFGVVGVIFVVFSVTKYGLFLSDRRTLGAVAFLLMGLLSYFTLSANGYGFEEWSRGFVPFLFLLLFLFLGELDEGAKVYLSKALFVACLVWAARIIAEALVSAAQGSDVLTSRLTYHVTDAVMVFPFIAITYLMFGAENLSAKWRWPLLALFGYLLVWIGYRAGIVIAAIPVAFFLLDNFARKRAWPIAALIVLIATIYFSGIFESFGLLQRYDNLTYEGDGAKATEWAYAIDMFLQAPLTGMGLGWQVPGDIAYIGVDTSDIIIPNTVGYIHSAFAYMAMNLGVFGVFIYYMVVAPRIFSTNSSALHKYSSLALLLLLLFGLTQVSFRTIQTIILTVALVKINARTNFIN